ncbi:hypothetical protein TTRE_0000018401 [Trichuris trichiura]|uniref:Abnormal cell migration protein 18-like fibronectin type I domain-containing protein n=1 Tax=Trichuris trichiura TaxID=36087 RepID=A0A077YZX8_TRITR|nr:hypothetical protein TTRE_0000018401 [Trichuris trichiura]
MERKFSMFLVFHAIFFLAASYPRETSNKVSSVTFSLQPTSQQRTQGRQNFDGTYAATKEGRGSTRGYTNNKRGNTVIRYRDDEGRNGIVLRESIKSSGESHTSIERHSTSFEFEYGSSGSRRKNGGSTRGTGRHESYTGIRGDRGSTELSYGGKQSHSGTGDGQSIKGIRKTHTSTERHSSSTELSYASSGGQRRKDGSARGTGRHEEGYTGISGGHGSIELNYEGKRPHSGIGGSGIIGGYGGGYAGMEGGHNSVDISYEDNFSHGCKGNHGGKGSCGCNGGHGSHGCDGGYERGENEGCKDDSGRHVNFGETYRKGNFIFKCKKLNDITVVLAPVKCVLDEKQMRIGEKRRKGGFLYACFKTKNGITLDIVGCFGDNEDIAEFGETFTLNNFIFMCAKEGDAGLHKPYGCLIEDKQVRIGQTVQVRSFLYKCFTSKKGSIQMDVVACLDKSGKEIDFGRRYRDGGFLYECEKTESGVRTGLVGCVAKVSGIDKEFTFGESWITDPSGPLSYKMKCIRDETKAMVDVTHCVANLEYAKSVAPLNSHVQLPKNMVLVCRRQADGKILNRVMTCDDFEKNERKFFCKKAYP